MTFNLDALIAEREPAPAWEFTFGGEGYELPGSPDMVALLMLSEDTTAAAGFARLLGADQWTRIQASPALLDPESFAALIGTYTSAVGADLGESGASATS